MRVSARECVWVRVSACEFVRVRSSVCDWVGVQVCVWLHKRRVKKNVFKKVCIRNMLHISQVCMYICIYKCISMYKHV